MDFMGKRKIWYGLSSLVIVIGIISLLLQGLNFGIDFTGGSLLHLRFQEKVSIEQVRSGLADLKLEKSLIQAAQDGSFIIKTVELEQAEQDKLVKGLKDKLGKADLLRSEKVGPVIGKELRIAGLTALAIASVLMVAYITVRFEFKFALAAIIALLHDVFVVVGFFSILQLEVDGAFVAAVLTVLGYSINDTIVIFDRIRENLRNRKKESLCELVNNSIQQTLARSLNTGVTTIFVLLTLIFFGGETTKNFALAMFIGIVTGAYSSIFVASPLWHDLKLAVSKKNYGAKA